MSGKKSTVGVKVGDKAPDFILPDYDGKDVALSSFRGKKVVLYFCPKDNTPGCTKEACSFRDGLEGIKKRGAVVLGASVDSVGSHIKFRDKYQLNFPLLSDVNKDVVQVYGVWKEKSLYGRKFMGIERTTFIDEDGRIACNALRNPPRTIQPRANLFPTLDRGKGNASALRGRQSFH